MVTPIQFRPVVQQAELRRIVGERAMMAFHARSLEALEESVLMRMVNGAEVEPGIHIAWLETAIRGRKRRQILEIR